MKNYFSNFEKGALVAFGCDDKEVTVCCLTAAANAVTKVEDRRKLLRLIDKIKNLIFTADYYNAFRSVMDEMNKHEFQSAVDYQSFSGKTNPKPWINYLRALLVEAFCSEDIGESASNVRYVWKLTLDPCISCCLYDLKNELICFLEMNDGQTRYEKFLAMNRDIIHRAENRKKKGKEEYRQYVWEVPRLNIYKMSD